MGQPAYQYFYVEVVGLISVQHSVLHEINSGTIQGSILGPILCAIYVAPLFKIPDLSNFVDDSFILTTNSNKNIAIAEMKNKLKSITVY